MLYLILDLTGNINARAPVLILPTLQYFVLPSFTPLSHLSTIALLFSSLVLHPTTIKLGQTIRTPNQVLAALMISCQTRTVWNGLTMSFMA
jgi:hypothetical protein